MKKSLLFTFSSILFAHYLHAQSDTISTHQLSEVQITTSAKPSNIRSNTSVQTFSVSDIDRIGIQSISDAIRRFSGVVVKDYGGIGGLKTVNLRGLGAEHTAVLYDGMAVNNSQSGQIDISRFSLNNISMLSLTIGQMGDIFQTARASASVGVLAIKTITPDFLDGRKWRGQAQLKVGSWGFINPYIYYAQKLDKRFSISLDTGWERASGDYPYDRVNGNQIIKERRYNTDVNIFRTEFNIFGNFSKDENLNLKFNYFNSERGLPGAIVYYSPQNSHERLWDSDFFSQVKYVKRITRKLNLQLQGKYSYLNTKFSDLDENQIEGGLHNRFIQHEAYISSTVLYQLTRELSTSLAQDLVYNQLRANYETFVSPNRYTSLTAFSVKYDRSNFTLLSNLLATSVKDKVQQDNTSVARTHISPSLSISYLPLSWSNLRLRASYNDIFRVATFNELYYKTVGNTHVKPEKGAQYNLGLTWAKSLSNVFTYINFTADIYHNRLKDKIFIFPASFGASAVNLGRVIINGLDLTANAHINMTDRILLQMQGNYTFQDAKDRTNSLDKHYNHQIPYAARHSGSGSLSVDNPWINMSYSFVASGKMYAEPQNIDRNKINGFIDHTLSFNKEMKINGLRCRLQGDILNLTNKTYYIIMNYPMPGRAYRILLNVNF